MAAGADRPQGTWEYSLANNDGTTSADGTLDLNEKITRIWQISDEGGAPFEFWVDVYSGYARESSTLGFIAASPGSKPPSGGTIQDLQDFVLDDGTAEIYAGSTSGAFILANRFTASTPLSLTSVSFYTSGWAARDLAVLIVYEDLSGAEPGPVRSMEVWRTTFELGRGDFQTVLLDCPALNPGGAPEAAFFVAVANTATRLGEIVDTRADTDAWR